MRGDWTQGHTPALHVHTPKADRPRGTHAPEPLKHSGRDVAQEGHSHEHFLQGGVGPAGAVCVQLPAGARTCTLHSH